jgi:ribosomal protein S27E
MFSESEYALTELGSASRLRRGSGGAHEGTSSNMIKVLEHWVRQDDPVIDELSDEAGLYELRVQRESVYIRGELVAPRRVFVTVPGFEGYEHVGWIVRIDCKSCMVCAKPFAREAEKMNCNACGNVVCKVRCGGNSGIVAELPPGVGPVLVCVQCYWGQEPVHAVIHEDELISPFIVRRTRSNISAYGNQASALRKLSTDSNRASLNVGFGLSTESKAKFETAETVAPRAVTPVPRFVLLTKTHAGRSLYVNVLEHNAIAPGTFVAGPVPREGVDRRQSGSGIAELERDGSAKADTSGMAGESYLIFDVSCNTDELNHAMTSENTDVLKCVSSAFCFLVIDYISILTLYTYLFFMHRSVWMF